MLALETKLRSSTHWRGLVHGNSFQSQNQLQPSSIDTVLLRFYFPIMPTSIRFQTLQKQHCTLLLSPGTWASFACYSAKNTYILMPKTTEETRRYSMPWKHIRVERSSIYWYHGPIEPCHHYLHVSRRSYKTVTPASSISLHLNLTRTSPNRQSSTYFTRAKDILGSHEAWIPRGREFPVDPSSSQQRVVVPYLDYKMVR